MHLQNFAVGLLAKLMVRSLKHSSTPQLGECVGIGAQNLLSTSFWQFIHTSGASHEGFDLTSNGGESDTLLGTCTDCGASVFSGETCFN
jgi:hypothetical protein